MLKDSGELARTNHKEHALCRRERWIIGWNYGGGEVINALLEIDPLDIKRLTKAKVADISEGQLLLTFS